MENLEQIKHNSNYAPGIATYGVDGEKGDKGLNGNNIFFTNMIGADDIIVSKELITKMQNNILLITGTNETITRNYQNGDYFFDEKGIIYVLKNKESLSDNTKYVDLFDKIAKIRLQDTSSFFEIINGEKKRLCINPEYNGFDIITTSDSMSAINNLLNNEVAMNIISSKINDDKINLLQLNAINEQGIEDGSLIIYYDITTNSYHFKSNNDIYIDSNVRIKDTDTQQLKDLDNYSTVLTSRNTITYFKYLCDKIQVDLVDYVDSETLLEYINVRINFGDNLDIAERIKSILEAIYAKIYIENVNYCYHLSDYTIITENTTNENIQRYIEIPILKSTIESKDKILMVSLLYNTEIFLAINR